MVEKGRCFHTAHSVCRGMGCGTSRQQLLAPRDQYCTRPSRPDGGKDRRSVLGLAWQVGLPSLLFCWTAGCIVQLETVPSCSVHKHFSPPLLLDQKKNCHKWEVGLWKLALSQRAQQTIYMIYNFKNSSQKLCSYNSALSVVKMQHRFF